MYIARVVKLMIASPSDVSTERNIIREVVHEWNAVHSEDRGLVLMPVSWETHARPSMGDRAQAIINKQLLQACDVLAAVFWTRIGSPTGAAPSGTVEEIQEHVRAGKQAMIYFSAMPVRLDSVDDAQYKELLAFKEECQRSGLLENYESYSEFREKFARQLAQMVIAEYSVGELEEVRAFAEFQAQRGRDPITESLSPAARDLLLEASADKDGTIMRFLTMAGLEIQTNNRGFVERGDPRSEALWDAALNQLKDLDLVVSMGYQGELFKMTNQGYETADRLRKGTGTA